ncbi:MAG: hypothetical protein KAY24_16525, partial [Candidatus Eisenbacteria sp.]|nr:hypothetical protein [Candidatus Eisenbacteria bacterium]
RLGVPRKKMVNMGRKQPAEVLNRMFELTRKDSTVIGIGNIGGFGLPFVGLLEQEQLREAAANDGEREPLGKGDPSPGERLASERTGP